MEVTNSGVYLIRNLYTKDGYVGSAHDFAKRWKLHKINLTAKRHHSAILQNAWNKYGPDAFEWVILERCPKDRVVQVEQEWLDRLTAKYNVCRVAGARSGVKNKPEHNQAISEKAKARWADPEFKARVSQKIKALGKPPTPVERIIEFEGRSQSLNAWALETGLKRETIAYRLNKGYPPAVALSTTKLKKGPRT